MTATTSPFRPIHAPTDAPARRLPGMLGGLGRWLGGGLLAVAALSAHAFDFETVAAKARQLSGAPYKPAPQNLPAELKDLSYERYRRNRIQARALCLARGAPAVRDFVLPRGHGVRSARAYQRGGGQQRARVPLRSGRIQLWLAQAVDAAKLKGLGFAGFRLLYPLNQGKRKDELASFLGASYFRALGKDQWYGLSARGLAVDTALNSGEEFPRFVEYWIERPSANDKQVTIYALMDSRRMSGAYRFVIKPGNETVMEVKSRLFLRENVTKLGLAPLTSMYLYGENQPSGKCGLPPRGA